MDKQYCLLLIRNRVKEAKSFGSPNIEERFWIPLSQELSKNIDETVDFLETLNAEDFLYSLEVLEEIVQNTNSKKILDEVRRIGMEKFLDLQQQQEVESRIKDAACWLEE